MSAFLSRREALFRSASFGLLAAASPALAARTGVDAASARGVVTRLFGKGAEALALSLEPSTGSRPWYAVDCRSCKVSITGDSPVALARGAYAWLRQTGAAHVSWEGDRVAWPAHAADFASGKVESPFAHRAYLNTCTYGYTTPWWGWTRWSREIDWMAVHGIDMPLAMEGQEHVWRDLWR